jgi:hypothetical protein
MPEYLAPAVYVEEVDTGSKPIEGVSTSTAGMIGVTERGPVNVPILITSFGEYTRWFGGALNRAEFGDHCYLPHAAEGFFTNGGKRVYVTRVLDAQTAAPAAFTLFDRGDATSANTLLLRPAAENTGTTANLPKVLVLPDANLAVNDWVRIGDGSHAEYRQLVAPSPESPDTVAIPLHMPLSRAHANPGGTVDVEQFTRGTIGAGYTLAVDAPATRIEPGTHTFVMSGTVANLDAFVNANMQDRRLLEVGGANVGEYRFVTAVTRLSPTTVRVTLDSPLLLAYDNGAPIAQLNPPLSAAVVLPPLPANIVATTPAAAQLDPAARAGDNMLYVVNRGTDFDVRADLVVIERGNTATREVRRIGELRQVTLHTGAGDTYPANTCVQAVNLADDSALSVAAPAPVLPTSTFTVNNAANLSIGQRLILGAGGNREEVVIQQISGNTITATTPLVFPKVVADPVVAVRSLTADAAAGANFLALNNRMGVAVGDVLRVGSLAEEEFVTITGFGAPVPTGVRPDAGTVLIAPPLARAHTTAATHVVRQNPPTLGAAAPCVLVLDAPAGSDALWVSDGGGGAGSFPANSFIRCTQPDGDAFYHRVVGISAAAVIPTMLSLNDALVHNHNPGSAVVEREAMIQVQALDAGSWGNRLRLSIEDEPTGLCASTRFQAVPPNPTQARLRSVSGIEPGSMLALLDQATGVQVGPYLKVNQANRATGEVHFDAAASLTPLQMGAAMTLDVRSVEFRLSAFWLRQPDPAQPSRNESVIASETFRHLSMDHRHSRYFQTVIGDINGPARLSDRRPEGESWYIRVHDLAQDLAEPQRTQTLQSVRLGPETLVDVLPDGRTRPARHEPLHLGNDGLLTLADTHYIGVDDPNPENRTGLQSLRSIEEVSIVAAPGVTSTAVQNALITHCEALRYRFAVLDGLRAPHDTMSDIQNQRQQFDSKYAALYHPWLLIPDPYATTVGAAPDYPVPPSGHMLGVYARTDIERGVHKAPANEVVRGITGLQRILNKEQQDILNPYPVNINVIRDFRNNNRGIRVYGGRCITSDSDWKYVNVRRLMIFIEASIDRGLQWVVFEPNAEPLWARVRRSISNFLTLVWRNGGLEGTKPEEAFFVKCDRTTMTQTDIDSGRLICVVGVAPVKPAEFVIVRIGLWTAHAED